MKLERPGGPASRARFSFSTNGDAITRSFDSWRGNPSSSAGFPCSRMQGRLRLGRRESAGSETLRLRLRSAKPGIPLGVVTSGVIGPQKLACLAWPPNDRHFNGRHTDGCRNPIPAPTRPSSTLVRQPGSASQRAGIEFTGCMAVVVLPAAWTWSSIVTLRRPRLARAMKCVRKEGSPSIEIVQPSRGFGQLSG